MKFDDFDAQVQSDEINPAEYEDWLRIVYGSYARSSEISRQEAYNTYIVDCDDGTHGDVIYAPIV